jgi:hypothetical protein
LVDKTEFREVVAFHLAAVLDQQPAINLELAKATGGHPKERILINFYLNTIYPIAVKGFAEEVSGKSTPDSRSSYSATRSDEATLSPTIIEERSAIWLGLMFRM